ncbi:hypothetical protein ACFL2V_01765 [Pseudomonadota bacterium]
MKTFFQALIRYATTCIAVLTILTGTAQAGMPPTLNFTDLINGPSSGLGDELGSGAIVTIWGYNLGSEQDTSKIYFKQTGSDAIEVAYVYYWKSADGALPGGPADLYSGHGMNEIAVSIPNSPNGAGELYAVVKGTESNRLPFTVRSGNILHVKATGDNSTATGTPALPYATVSELSSGAIKTAAAGDLIYVHDSIEEINGVTSGKLYGIFSSGHEATADNQTAIVAYPNSQPLAQGENFGIAGFLSYGIVVSKYRAQAGNQDAPSDNNILPHTTQVVAMRTNKDGRYVGNEITDIEGKCASGQQGGINGNALTHDTVSNMKILGNHIHDWGCDQSSHFTHTTYMSNRSNGSMDVAAWEYGYNYLTNNKTKFGLHSYDETFSGTCGDVTGTIRVHNNVIVNQKGPGISFGALNASGICWTVPLVAYNNILINTGLGPPDQNGVAAAAIRIKDRGLDSTVTLYNNTIYNWTTPAHGGRLAAIEISGKQDNISVDFKNNVFYTDQDVFFENSDADYADNVTGRNNFWHFSGSNPVNAITPTWDTNPSTLDPLITVNAAGAVQLDKQSPLIGAGTAVDISLDVTGFTQSASTPTVGAKHYLAPAPKPPTGLQVE